MTIQSTTPKRHAASGMTLLELSVILMTLMTFLGMSFIGVRAWKRGVDRTACIMNIYRTQMAVRSFSNLYGLAPGTDTAALAEPIDVKARLVGEDGYIGTEPECPGNGKYRFGGNLIPRPGALYLSCSLAAAGNHEPADYRTW